MQKLSDENQKLNDELREKASQLAHLNDRISDLSTSLQSLERSSLPAEKADELKKKNRHLTAELQSMKSKFKGLEENYRGLQSEFTEKLVEMQNLVSQSEKPSPTEMQILNEKLEKANKKVFEILNQNAQLKNDLKMANKALQQEVGENVNVSQILAGNSNWHGRARQITMLNSKIAELKEKLDNGSLYSFETASDGERPPLKRLESVRRMEIENLSKDFNDCKSQLNDLKQKVVAYKARNKNLADEASSYKLKTLELLEKSDRDEELIKCLNEQIAIIKYECNHKVEEARKEIERVEDSNQDTYIDIEKLQCELQNKEQLLDEKNNEIVNLRLSIEELEKNLRDVSGDFLFSCRQFSKDDYLGILRSLEEEKNKLLGFVRDLTDRLDRESIKTSEQHDTVSKQRIKISRLEAKLKEIEAEKEEAKLKNRRSLRISEYSRSESLQSVNSVFSGEKLTAEIDKHKFR